MPQSSDVAPAPAPAPPPPPPPRVIIDGVDRTVDVTPGAHEVLMALQAQRDELREQVQQLEHKREEITEQIRENRSQGLDISGLEQRLKDIDARISGIDQQLAIADNAVARQSAVPGAVPPSPPEPFHHDGGPPEGVFVLAGIFIVAVLMPISIAIGRFVWRRGGSGRAAAVPIPANLDDRLKSIEQAVESVAVEVERIGEGQRFMSRVFTDRAGGVMPDARALGEGAAPAIDVAQRHKVAEPR